MNVVEPETARPRMIPRIARLLTRPAKTWDEIDAEPSTLRAVFQGWVAPLAAIPTVCMALGKLLFPLGMLDLRYRSPVPIILAEAAASYLLVFVQVFLLAAAIDLLAPLFGGVRNRQGAVKLAAYSATPLWLFGVTLLLPSVGWVLVILGGLYSLYLLYVGLPRLTKSAPEQALTYFAVVLIIFMVLGVCAGWVLNHVRELGGPVSLQMVAPHD